MAELRFHWMLPKGGESDARETARVLTTGRASRAGRPDMDGWTRFAGVAEEAGIESVLSSFGNYEPDTLLVACALGCATKKLKFIAAYRLGLMQPTTFVQQVNTLSGVIGGRIALNVIAGSSPTEQRGYGDFLDHDQRYARAEEFLTICRLFWSQDGDVDFHGKHYRVEGGRLHTPFLAPGHDAPEIYVSGHSPAAEHLALTQGDCWVRVIDTPESLAPIMSRARACGVEMGLRLAVVCRPTREEAVRAAQRLRSDDESVRQVRSFLSRSDSHVLKEALSVADGVGWLNRSLWAGLVPSYGSSAITLVGTPEELAEAFLEYRRIGVTQFIISGWPKLEEMEILGREVVPRVRAAERAEPAELAGYRIATPSRHTERVRLPADPNGQRHGPMQTLAPRAFNREIYHQPNMVFYGTDDGAQDGSFAEWPEIQRHYDGCAAERRENIHMISVVGGLYGLNLIPLWKPKRLTIFDINPVAIAYFRVIHRVFTTSRDAEHFLDRLTHADYDADGDVEQFVRENIQLRQADRLPRSRGSSKRSYRQSWTRAFEHFDLTKGILSDVPLDIRTEPMETESFREWIRVQHNLWIYASNITQFHFFELEFADPRNVALVQIIFPGNLQILDLAPLGDGPVNVKFEIPLTPERIERQDA